MIPTVLVLLPLHVPEALNDPALTAYCMEPSHSNRIE